MDTKQAVKQIKQKAKPKAPEVPKFQGKGTRARLNTAANKLMFDSKYST